MRLTTRGRFAITALIDLSLREQGVPVPLVDLALRHQMSVSYLEQVFAKLRQAGIVESTRGPGGGYTLGARGDQISVAEIVEAIEDGVPDPEGALDRGTAYDFTADLWKNLHGALVEHMKSVSLRSLALEQKAKGYKAVERKAGKCLPAVAPQPQPVKTTAPNSVFNWSGDLPPKQNS
jgi:Rrf2 family iron-sulfur cluster assembly transcriptional regulator